MDSETAPLLSNQPRPQTWAPGSIGGSITSPPTLTVAVRPLDPSELPLNVDSAAELACSVCQAPIQLDGKRHQHVIKCTNCNEAMPIRPPPQGKIYVRCPCNCLLICRANSSKIGCPRKNCARVLTLPNNGGLMGDPYQSGGTIPNVGFTGSDGLRSNEEHQARVQCPYCENIFLTTSVQVTEGSYVQCSFCNRKSFASAYIRMKRMVLFFFITLLLFLFGVPLLIVTFATSHTWWLAFIWIPLFLFCAGSFVIALFYTCRPASLIISP